MLTVDQALCLNNRFTNAFNFQVETNETKNCAILCELKMSKIDYFCFNRGWKMNPTDMKRFFFKATAKSGSVQEWRFMDPQQSSLCTVPFPQQSK